MKIVCYSHNIFNSKRINICTITHQRDQPGFVYDYKQTPLSFVITIEGPCYFLLFQLYFLERPD